MRHDRNCRFALVVGYKLHPAGETPALTAPPLKLFTELFDLHGDRQSRIIVAGLADVDAESLTHPFDRETGFELAMAHGRVTAINLKRPGSTLGGHVDDLAQIQTGLLAEVHAFGQTLDHTDGADRKCEFEPGLAIHMDMSGLM